MGSIKNPNNFKEFPVIKGSVPMMIKRTMQTLQDLVIEEMVTKVNYQMEAIRRFNYPYQALEEVVVNAFYHRDYLSYQSIMIEIEPELIRIISFPGIDRSIPQRVIEEGERFSSRYYRNKRLGEFLKELDLSEGKSTGIPTIQEELRNNGSPKARFFTDDDRRAVTVEIPIHPDFLNRDEPQNEPQNKISEKIIELVKENNLISRKEMAEKLGCSMSTIKRALANLKEEERLVYEGSSRKGRWIIK